MAPPRSRLIAMTVALGLVAVLGVVWLVDAALTGGGDTVSESTTNPAATFSRTGTAGTTGPDDPDAPGGDTPGDTTTGAGTASAGTQTTAGETPGGGRKSVHYNGLHLDGQADDDSGCLTLINKTATAITVDRVSFFVVTGPVKPAVRSDAAHCYEEGDELDPPCVSYRVIEGRACLAGAILPQGALPGKYLVRAVADISFVCDNTTVDPCDKVPSWNGPPPKPNNPVKVSGTASPKSGLDLNMSVEGTEPEPQPDSSPSSQYSPPTDNPPTSEVTPSPDTDSPSEPEE
ncbi:hypothetical protein [Streptomyces sp. Ag109_G2-15]|uniref:hypothetical protein n=1 Tax=Streptomyces sp. Ag109_G2-15 TaxID=1938850 RepID=UPI000BE36AFF|nr:hypothetical protein [Streptomyces sp. Ag109_G2-15]